MGALTGQTVQSSYLDLVQLGKSGAGLPSHAGKEAAVYDGSGAQILGRTAVRHWLDPHPDAASFDETWEFSTTGDMTQGQLETAGWTFTSCAGSVSGGAMWLQRTASAYWSANLAVSLAGDFDIVVGVIREMDYTTASPPNYLTGGFGVADTVNNVAHHQYGSMVNGYGRTQTFINGAWTTFAGTGANSSFYGPPRMLRIWRVSGTVYLAACSTETPLLKADDTLADRNGWSAVATVSDADTFDKLFFKIDSTVGDGVFGVTFIRRFQ